jgi:hypothetical protein
MQALLIAFNTTPGEGKKSVIKNMSNVTLAAIVTTAATRTLVNLVTNVTWLR